MGYSVVIGRQENMQNKLKTDQYPALGTEEYVQWVSELWTNMLRRCQDNVAAWKDLEEDFDRFITETAGIRRAYSLTASGIVANRGDGVDGDEDISCKRCGWVGPEASGCRCWEIDA